jgi:hypothetical protein
MSTMGKAISYRGLSRIRINKHLGWVGAGFADKFGILWCCVS